MSGTRNEKKANALFKAITCTTLALTLAFTVWFIADADFVIELLYRDMHPLGDVVMALMFLPTFYVFFVIPLFWVEFVAHRAVKYFGLPEKEQTKAETRLRIASVAIAALVSLLLILITLDHILGGIVFALDAVRVSFRCMPIFVFAGFVCELAAALIVKRRRAKEREGEQE